MILVIPDVHVAEGSCVKHLHLLHGWLTKRKPPLDTVVFLGDWWDFPSLCLHDKENAGLFRRSLQKDLDAGAAALQPFYDYFRRRSIQMHFTVGNHEHRFDKWRSADWRTDTLSDIPSFHEWFCRKFPRIHLHPFLEVFSHSSGVNFSHYFVSGTMGRPISSARRMLSIHMHTCVAGHQHTFDYAVHGSYRALIAGCFVGRLDDRFNFAKGSLPFWQQGISILHPTGVGTFDLEFISLKRLDD